MSNGVLFSSASPAATLEGGEPTVRFRPEYPESVFDLLFQLGVGRPGQEILDIGSGTGEMALGFARGFSNVTVLGHGAAEIARLEARSVREEVTLRILDSARAVAPFPSSVFDVVTARDIWDHPDREAALREVHRILRPGGIFLVRDLAWRGDDPIARTTDWILRGSVPGSAGRSAASIEIREDLEPRLFQLKSFHLLSAEFSFSQPTWKDWVRSSRKLDLLPDRDVDEALDLKLSEWLKGEAPERFKVPHRIALHAFQSHG